MTHPVQTVVRLAMASALLVLAGVPAMGQAAAPSASPAKAKDLAAALKAKKLEAYAMRESLFENRFVAVMVLPDVQTLLVSALYSRPTDIEYRIYQKDYATAYGDLVSGALGSERFFVEDVLGDGLMATPAKNGVPDTVTMGGTKQLFEGPADPKKRNDKRMPLDAYMKVYSEADRRYAALLDTLIQELKKAGVVAPVSHLR